MADLLGQRLGNYRLLRIIGRGSFADVYLAEHIHLGTQAAIKVLQVRLMESNRESFLNEARTIAHLVHPYIIRVLDFGVQDEIPFLVMDYAPRGTFGQRFLRGKPLPAAPLVPFIKQTAAALQYGHDKKLVHRDVKPENMLLGPHDEVLLSDFGFALIAHNSTSRSQTETAGTAAYMAPEQLQGKPRPASDQYALGVIAYEWLSGQCPFRGSFFEVASQQVLAPPPPLQARVSTIAPEIVRVIMTALEKNPQQRFPSVRDFALALEEACLTSKQYAFNLHVMQQSSPPISNTGNVTFFGGNRHSRDNLPLPNSVPDGIDASSVSLRTTNTTYTTLNQPPSVPDQSRPVEQGPRSLPRTTLPRLRIQSQHSGAPDPRRLLLNQPPQATPAPHPPSSPSAETYLRSAAERHSDVGWPPLKDMPSSAELQAQNNTGLETLTPLAPLHFSPGVQKRDWPGGPGRLLLIGLLVLLVIGVGAGTYSYFTHSKNAGVAQTAQVVQQSVQQAQSTPQPDSIGTMSPTATQGAALDTTNPYPPHGGIFVMNEILTSNNYGWIESATTTAGGACQFSATGYQDYDPVSDPNPCFANNTNFVNFAYQVDMKFTVAGQFPSGAGVLFRGNSTTNRYYYFEIYSTGKYSLQVCNMGNCTVQLAGYKTDTQALNAFRPGLNVTNTLAVVAVGSKFNLYLNNQPIKEVVDANNTYISGMVGVMATGGNNNQPYTPTRAVFSNAKVWKL